MIDNKLALDKDEAELAQKTSATTEIRIAYNQIEDERKNLQFGREQNEVQLVDVRERILGLQSGVETAIATHANLSVSLGEGEEKATEFEQEKTKIDLQGK